MTGEWRADPFGRHEYRYWDGTTWTEHVSDQGAVNADPVGPDNQAPPPPPIPAGPYPPPGAGAPVYVAAPRNNGLAIASMVLGIVWVYWIGSILAVIFGHIALSQIKRSRGAQRGRGMAIAGVVLGYVGIALLVVTIVVVAVASDDTASSASCRADRAVLEAAEAAYYAGNNTYATESDLVPEYLTRESDLHDIRLFSGGRDFEVVATDACS
jgi:hypothetical protein